MLTESEKESIKEMSKIFVNEIFNEQPIQLLDSVDDSNRNDNNIQNK